RSKPRGYLCHGSTSGNARKEHMEKLSLKDRNEAAVELDRLWRILLTVKSPDMIQYYRWLDLHYVGFLAQAITRCAEKEERMAKQNEEMSQDMAIRWASKVANRIK